MELEERIAALESDVAAIKRRTGMLQGNDQQWFDGISMPDADGRVKSQHVEEEVKPQFGEQLAAIDAQSPADMLPTPRIPGDWFYLKQTLVTHDHILTPEQRQKIVHATANAGFYQNRALAGNGTTMVDTWAFFEPDLAYANAYIDERVKLRLLTGAPAKPEDFVAGG